MAWSLDTPPEGLAVDLETAKAQCRAAGLADDDAYFADVAIPAAADRAELATQRQLLQATWVWQLDSFPCAAYLEVPKPPLIAVTSITYVDTAGVTQTWAANQYQVDAPSGPRCRRGRIMPAYGVSWPATRGQLNAVTLTVTAGYGRAEDIPALLRMGMLLDVGRLFEHREDVVMEPGLSVAIEPPWGARAIYRSFKSYATQ